MVTRCFAARVGTASRKGMLRIAMPPHCGQVRLLRHREGAKRPWRSAFRHTIVPDSCPRTAFRLRRPSITPYRHCSSSRGSEATVAICPKHTIVPGSCPRTAFRLRRPSITPYRHCSSSRGSEATVAICFKHPILPRSCPRTAFHRARPISHGDLRSKPMLGEDAGTINDATCSCKVRRPCKVFDRRSLHIIEMGHHFNSPILVCIGRKAGLHDQCCSLPRC